MSPIKLKIQYFIYYLHYVYIHLEVSIFFKLPMHIANLLTVTFKPSPCRSKMPKKKTVDFCVPTVAGLNNSLTRPMENIRCISDDTKLSLEFILGFDYTVYSKKKDLCNLL